MRAYRNFPAMLSANGTTWLAIGAYAAPLLTKQWALWPLLTQFTAYKAGDAGRLVLQVDPRNTSKMCSRCKSLVPKDLVTRVHHCPHCGLLLDRAHNAAIHILALGLQRVNATSVDEVVEAHSL